MSIDIIIVNWNSGKLLNDCLQAIASSETDKLKLKIYIVDNNSSDGSFLCTSVYENVVLIKNTENKGFGAACNQAIRMGDGKYVLLLNPDTKVEQDTLFQTATFMEENPNIDVMGCRHIDSESKTKISCSTFPKLSRIANDTLGLSFLWPKIFKPAVLMTYWNHETSCYVDQVMGAYMCICRKTLDKVGLFDEQFFVYYEDMDLSKRIVDNGGHIFYNANIAIYHEGEGTTKQIKATRLLYSLQSRLKYYKKYFSKPKYILSKLLVLFVEPITRTFFSLIKLDVKGVKNTWIAYIRLYKELFFK